MLLTCNNTERTAMPSMIFVNLPVADLAAANRQGLSRALFPVASRLTSMAWTFRA